MSDQEEIRLIPVRSHKQAMDWSLVLMSQGISAVIEQLNENEWALAVGVEDYEQATGAIRQYRLENRRWRWRQPLAWVQRSFHYGAAVWCAWLVLVHWIGTTELPAIRVAGQMDSSAVRNGEWWRMFTAIILHSDVGHLLGNVATGFVLWGLAMATYGAGVGLLGAYIAGALGNVAGLMMYAEPHRGWGASGMVLGGLGLITAHAVSTWRGGISAVRFVIRAALAGLLLFVLLGTDPSSDVIAHLGGFLGGLIVGLGLSGVSMTRFQSERVQLASGIVLAGAVITTSTVALWR